MKTLEQKVMARVYRIYYLRKATSYTALKLYGLCGIMVGLFSVVSVANVFANMSSVSTPMQALAYLTRAALHTESTVQLLLLGLFFVLVLMVRDIARNQHVTGSLFRSA